MEAEHDLNDGRLELAEFKLMVLDRLAPDSLPIKNAWQLLFIERDLRVLLPQAQQALARNDLQEASEICAQALRISPFDDRAKKLRQKLTALIQPPAPVQKKVPDRIPQLAKTCPEKQVQREHPTEPATAGKILEMQPASPNRPDHFFGLALLGFGLSIVFVLSFRLIRRSMNHAA